MLGVLPALAERDHMGAAEGDPSVRPSEIGGIKPV